MAGAARDPSGGISLQLALLLLVAAAFLAGIVPAGMMLERWVAREMEARVRADLALAPRLLADRNAAVGDAAMMHAKEVAHIPALAALLAGGSRDAAVRAAEDVARAFHSGGVVIGRDGAPWSGPAATPAMIEATRRGEMPVGVVSDDGRLFLMSIAPVHHQGVWTGAAGVAVPVDEAAAGALAGLTRAELVVVVTADGARVASPANHPLAADVARLAGRVPAASGVHFLPKTDQGCLYTAAAMQGATVIFVRDLRRELGMLGPLRGALAVTGALALALALLLGAVLARVIARPVRVLAAAAGSVSRGDFTAPLPVSPVREVARVTGAFGGMRAALAVRIEELRNANRLLEERQVRLTALQSELIQRERVAAGGRVAAELAHEIRNPVANLRNCLELLQRRLVDDAEGREYAALAIDELLRMHELAERMLHLNRPRDPDVGSCDAAGVAREVAALARIGSGAASISVVADGPAPAAIPPDALKQVLINLVQNARDAIPHGLDMEIIIERRGGSIQLTTCDNGPGIPEPIRASIFDPFFTTRATAGGVGLGLFLVEGVVRGHGGSVTVEEAPGGGACFRIRLPVAVEAAPPAATGAEASV